MHWLSQVVCSALRQSPHVPRHVAFIMDGNRRYARTRQQRTADGHSKGYEKLKETLEWCLEVGVKMVTVYAFSIDNFKRTPEEVEQLMRLAKDKFIEMIQSSDLIEKYDCCVRVLGDLSLLPADVREAMEGAVAASRHKTRVTLNVCMSYTHQREMTQAAGLIQGALREGVLIEDDVDAELLQASLYTGISATLSTEVAASVSCAATAASSSAACCAVSSSSVASTTAAAAAAASASAHTLAASSRPCAPCLSRCFVPAAPDLLIRTSGETRLSDFLLFQSACETQLAFTPTLWPSFSLRELGCILLQYQRVAASGDLDRRRQQRIERSREARHRQDEAAVLRILREERRCAAQHQLRLDGASFTAAASSSYAHAAEPDAHPSSSATSSTCDDHSRAGSPDLPEDAAVTAALATSAAAGLRSRRSRGHSTPSPTSSTLTIPTHSAAVSTSEESSSDSSSCNTSSRGSVSEHEHEHEHEADLDAPPADDSSALWHPGVVVNQALIDDLCDASLTKLHSRNPSQPDSEADSLSTPLLISDEEIAERVRQYAAEREQRLRAFTLYARQHTSSLI